MKDHTCETEDALEVLCENCNGSGNWRSDDGCSGAKCHRCNGAGYVPTEGGDKILTLIRHNYCSLRASSTGHE